MADHQPDTLTVTTIGGHGRARRGRHDRDANVIRTRRQGDLVWSSAFIGSEQSRSQHRQSTIPVPISWEVRASSGNERLLGPKVDVSLYRVPIDLSEFLVSELHRVHRCSRLLELANIARAEQCRRHSGVAQGP